MFLHPLTEAAGQLQLPTRQWLRAAVVRILLGLSGQCYPLDSIFINLNVTTDSAVVVRRSSAMDAATRSTANRADETDGLCVLPSGAVASTNGISATSLGAASGSSGA